MLRTPIATIALLLSVTAFAGAQFLPGRDAGGNAPAAGQSPSGFGRAPANVSGQYPGQSQAPSGLNLTPAPGNPQPATGAVGAGAAPASEDRRLYQSGAVIPEPMVPEANAQPSFALPTAPIEPYLLQRHNGPFMVMAKTFRGPDAARYAQALAMELRSQYGMPAYVWYLRFQPGRSNIRNVPPTAPDYVRGGETVAAPERFRANDEAAVLVGDCKTIDESEEVLKQVKKIHSVVLDGTPSLWNWTWRKGLGRAWLTTNPLVASQQLFPHKDVNGKTIESRPAGGHTMASVQSGQEVDPYVLTAGFQNARKEDPLVKQMNDPRENKRSLYNCTGAYALQVAEFMGRATTDQNDPRFSNNDLLKQSPLVGAAVEAERLAEGLAKCKTLPAGLKPFVYHDRFSSRVLLGPINSPNDPNLPAMVEHLNGPLTNELVQRRFTQLPLTPANQLTPVPRD